MSVGTAERSFAAEVRALSLGEGEYFHGEGILAVTKALLESGVSYVGGYQGAPISHLMDVLADASEILDRYGVHFEVNASEASAAAMLSASINYPLRGAVTWKSTVGTNVASDALSNLASAGVMGGVVILLGEDYGEGASIMQERSHAFAMKSSMWLLDPRPNLPTIVSMVRDGFDLSEASNTPVMLELRIRTCHMHGRFVCRDNIEPRFSRKHPLQRPNFDPSKIILPPATYAQEKQKFAERLPAALKFISERGLNELMDGDLTEIGIIMQGGMFNTVQRALEQLGLADCFGGSRLPRYVLNVTYPLVPREIEDFCQGKKAVLMVEESQPDFLEQNLHSILGKAGIRSVIHGKGLLPMAGEYTSEVMLKGLADFLAVSKPAGLDLDAVAAKAEVLLDIKQAAIDRSGEPVPVRPPTFCTGCPERPVFSAIKLVERELGPTHVSADIGCHSFATLAPFNVGNTIMGYGLSLASSSAVAASFGGRTLSIMGDGGFWHNGLSSGITNAVFNGDDSVLLVMDNFYSAATGQQDLPSSPVREDGSRPHMPIETALRSLGVKWIQVIHSYDMTAMVKALSQAMTTEQPGLKVIIAKGECQLVRQRRARPLLTAKLAAKKRVVDTRYGVDAALCTGDHSCIRLSGCPSLTIKDNPDPLRLDPVAHVDQDCVGCGHCGEVAHAARLCPSFYSTDLVMNPSRFERLVDGMRRRIISLFLGGGMLR